MKFGFLILVLSSFAHADSYIDICNRGQVGRIVAWDLHSQDCSKVSVDKMAKLESLDLSYSRLSYSIGGITKNAFEGLTSLKSLNLSGQNIVSIENASLDGLARLENLKLANTRLKNLPNGIFKELKLLSLRKLDLSRNKNLNIDVDALKGLDLLQELNLEWVQDAYPLFIQSLNGLKTLDLSNSRDAWGCSGSDSYDVISTIIPQYIENLSLRNYCLQTINDGAFSRFTNIKLLDLRGNMSNRDLRNFSRTKAGIAPEVKLLGPSY